MQIIVVTPEKSVLDQQTEAVTLPMFDGERGVLPGHTPFVGQLGPGELRIGTGTTMQRYFIEGGFVQVSKNIINILTPKALHAIDIDADKATRLLADAEMLAATNPLERDARTKTIEKAQSMARFANKKV